MSNTVYTFNDVVDYADSALNGFTDCPPGNRQSRGNAANQHWDYSSGFDGAVELARTGWAEGRERVEEQAMRFRDDVVRDHDEEFARPATVRAFAGPMVNIGRYIAGAPDAMLTRKRTEMESPVIDILCNVAASGSIGAETYFTRGAAVAALADLLELTGRRVRVRTIMATKNNQHSIEIYTTIKGPGDPLQMDALAFTLAHPAFMRRLGFAIMEQAPMRVRRAIGIGDGGYGYGTPTDVENTADIYMPCILSSNDWSERKAINWVREQLIQLGVLKNEED
jgi:hypothetical protein